MIPLKVQAPRPGPRGPRLQPERDGRVRSSALRLCVELDAVKTLSRKGAKAQRINPNRARHLTSSATAGTATVERKVGVVFPEPLVEWTVRTAVRWSAIGGACIILRVLPQWSSEPPPMSFPI